MSKKVYMDHNATTPVDAEVLEAMLPYLKESFGNASSVHDWGKEARYGVEKARLQLASLLNTLEDRIFFTSCGTESNNTILLSIAKRFAGEGCHIVTSSIEHPAVYRCLDDLEEAGMVSVTSINPDKSGVVDPSQVEEAIRGDTRLVSVMWANNETGAIQPIAEITNIAHGKGVWMHSDTVQALGKVPVDLSEVDLDFASFSAHKIYGPKGIGAFYAKDPTHVTPMIRGGGQEGKLRAGTEAVPFIVAMGAASEKCGRLLKEEASRLSNLRDGLQNRITKEVEGVHVCAGEADRLPGTLCVCFESTYGTYLVLDLAEEGVAVSSGSACSANKSEPSHVLLGMGLPSEIAQGAVRFSLGRANDEKQIDLVVGAVKQIVQKQRSQPPQIEEELDLLSICD